MSYDRVHLIADARPGMLASRTETLSSTPGEVLSIPIPNWARGFLAEPSAACRFAINENPVAEQANQLTAGGRLPANVETTRLFDGGGVDRTLRLISGAAGPSIYVEFF